MCENVRALTDVSEHLLWAGASTFAQGSWGERGGELVSASAIAAPLTLNSHIARDNRMGDDLMARIQANKKRLSQQYSGVNVDALETAPVPVSALELSLARPR